MPLKIQRSRYSKIDLFDIWDFIAADNKKAAEKLLQEIGARVMMIADNPEIGRVRADLGEGIRSFPIGGYMIFYDRNGDTLRLLRVLHDARDVKAELFASRD